MRMDMKKWIFDISNSNERFAFPIMTYPGMELINKRVPDIVYNPELQFRCMEALAKKYPAVAIASMMDLSVEAEAFGCRIRCSDDEVPNVMENIVKCLDDVEKLMIPKLGDARTGVYLESVRLAAENIKDRPAFGGCIGPISLCSRLYDMTEMMMALILEPETIHKLLEKTTEFITSYVQAFKDVGANGIIIAEPTAGLLSPEQCTEFSSNYIKRIVDKVQNDNFMVIIHNCGNTTKLVDSLVSTGSMGFHFGNAVKMEDILPQVPVGRIALGNIDSARILKNGTVEEVTEKVTELLDKTSEYNNFVLSSGCDVPPHTPKENVDAFYDALKTYNEKVIGNIQAEI